MQRIQFRIAPPALMIRDPGDRGPGGRAVSIDITQEGLAAAAKSQSAARTDALLSTSSSALAETLFSDVSPRRENLAA